MYIYYINRSSHVTQILHKRLETLSLTFAYWLYYLYSGTKFPISVINEELNGHSGWDQSVMNCSTITQLKFIYVIQHLIMCYGVTYLKFLHVFGITKVY